MPHHSLYKSTLLTLKYKEMKPTYIYTPSIGLVIAIIKSKFVLSIHGYHELSQSVSRYNN